MPQDATCPKCNNAFPVTQARHPVGVDCPGCATELTVEFRKRPSPIEPGVAPYELDVKRGKPQSASAASPVAPQKHRREDDEEAEEKSTGNGGSMAVVVLAGVTAMIFALAGLGTTGYFLFTNLDTSDSTINKISTTQNNQGGHQPGGNQFGKPGGIPGIPGVGPSSVKNHTYEFAPVTGALPAINVPALTAVSSTLQLDAKVGAMAIGGGGRYVVMHFPETGQLGVFDASTAQMTLTMTDTGDVKVAAGLSRIVTLATNANTMRVFSIQEPRTADQKLGIQKLFDSPIPVNGLGSIVVGSKTNGPLIGVGTFGGIHIMEISATSVTEIEEARNDGLQLHWGGGSMLRATPDGRAYLTCDNLDRQDNNKKVKLAFWDKQWKKREISQVPFPGPEGRLLYGNGVVTNLRGDDQRYGGVGMGSGEWFVPAVCGTTGAFLKVTQGVGKSPAGRKKDATVTVTMHNKGNANLAAEGTPTLTGLPEFEGLFDGRGNPQNDKPFDRHFFLFPEAKLLAILSSSKDKILLRKVDLR